MAETTEDTPLAIRNLAAATRITLYPPTEGEAKGIYTNINDQVGNLCLRLEHKSKSKPSETSKYCYIVLDERNFVCLDTNQVEVFVANTIQSGITTTVKSKWADNKVLGVVDDEAFDIVSKKNLVARNGSGTEVLFTMKVNGNNPTLSPQKISQIPVLAKGGLEIGKMERDGKKPGPGPYSLCFSAEMNPETRAVLIAASFLLYLEIFNPSSNQVSIFI